MSLHLFEQPVWSRPSLLSRFAYYCLDLEIESIARVVVSLVDELSWTMSWRESVDGRQVFGRSAIHPPSIKRDLGTDPMKR